MKKSITTVLVVFALLIGNTVSAQNKKAKHRENGGDKGSKVENLKAELNLSEEQAAQIKELFQNQKVSRKAISEERKMLSNKNKAEKQEIRKKTLQLKEERMAELAQILSPEQLQKLKELEDSKKKERRESRRLKNDLEQAPTKEVGSDLD